MPGPFSPPLHNVEERIMTRAKKTKTVAVRLSCIYSGHNEAWSPGQIIEVDSEEADRLCTLGAAEMVDDKD